MSLSKHEGDGIAIETSDAGYQQSRWWRRTLPGWRAASLGVGWRDTSPPPPPRPAPGESRGFRGNNPRRCAMFRAGPRSGLGGGKRLERRRVGAVQRVEEV